VDQKTSLISYAEPTGQYGEVSKSNWRKWIRNSFKTKVAPLVTERRPSPEQTANFLSLISFDWVNRLLSVGYKRSLTGTDFFLLNESRRSDGKNERIMQELHRRAERGNKHPLLFSLFVFSREYWLAGISQLLTTSILGLSPLLLKAILWVTPVAKY
jgi:ATP-binding cassette subfamily C (CFTR/MRP) protein 1